MCGGGGGRGDICFCHKAVALVFISHDFVFCPYLNDSTREQDIRKLLLLEAVNSAIRVGCYLIALVIMYLVVFWNYTTAD